MHAKQMSINQLISLSYRDRRVVSAHPLSSLFTPTPTSNKHFCVHIFVTFLNCSTVAHLVMLRLLSVFPSVTLLQVSTHFLASVPRLAGSHRRFTRHICPQHYACALLKVRGVGLDWPGGKALRLQWRGAPTRTALAAVACKRSPAHARA